MIRTRNHIEQLFDYPSMDLYQDLPIYFLGIGGIGMSALARYFKSKGCAVSGYDKTETPLTRQLETEGISVHYEDNINRIDKNAAFVVYTPAIPNDHQEYCYLIENGYVLLKRSEVLGFITKRSFNICIAGTHGKTTTSTMTAHILRQCGLGCNAFLGGISTNYNTNFWSHENNLCVIEADEYDRSFLQLNPDIAIITAIDPDHLDIYETAENFSSAFVAFTAKIKKDGLLINKKGLERTKDFQCSKKMSYDLLNAKSDIYATNIQIKNGTYHFDVMIGEKLMTNFVLNMGGLHNVENAIAAIAVAVELQLNEEHIKDALASFKGVKRRFEYILNSEDFIMIDDYAHHPQELEALITGVKGLYPEKKCTVVFQPHLYSRTRDFAEGFAQALNLADEVFLLPIYPAREMPIAGVTSEIIATKMLPNKANVVSKEELMHLFEKENHIQLLITAGAGDIDALITPIQQAIYKRIKK